jgi:hypothetical protein
MSDKSASKKKAAKRPKQQASVLGSLPATRPTRLGRHAAATDGATDAAAAPRPAAKRPAAKPRATTTARAAAAKPKPRPATPPPPRREPPPEPPPRTGPPSGPELVTTAVQAVGEIAQIGVTLGVRAVRRAVSRIPHP